MSRPLHYSPEALSQLDELESYLVERAGPRAADAYIDRLLAYCDGLAEEPTVGHRRDDLLPGLMTRVFEKSRVVCFLHAPSGVHVVAIYSSRQNWEGHLRDSAK